MQILRIWFLWDGHLPMFTMNFDIALNTKGEFVSVEYQGQTYTIAEWNKNISSTPLERSNDSKNTSDKETNLRSMFPRVVTAYGIVIKEGWEGIEEAMHQSMER